MNESVVPGIRFSLKTLLLLMLAVSAGCWLVDRYVSDRARFEILETNLSVQDGYVSGSMSFRCNRLNDRGNIEFSDTVLRVEHVADNRMSDLKVGDELFVRYRQRDFGPIAKENRYVIFLVRELGVQKEEIVGFVQMDGWAEVHVRGSAGGTE